VADSDMANEAAQGIEDAEAAREERAAEAIEPELVPEEPVEEARVATREEKRKARAAQKPKSSRTYTKARLVEEAYDFMGLEPHLLSGALYEMDDDDEMTVADAKAAVTEWLKREV
jgi:hypothetical protein